MNAILSTPAKEFVKYALQIGAIELFPEGKERKLKNGRLSPYFFNSGLFDTGYSLGRAAAAYAASIGEVNGVVIYGPPYKGTLLAGPVAMVLGKDRRAIGYASSRKEAKDHGEGGILLGHSLKGMDVIIVDDVITDGATKAEAVEFVRAQGGNPISCAIAFDRQERGKDGDLSAAQEFSKKFEIPVKAAATLDDLLSVLISDSTIPGNDGFMVQKIQEYREQYGVRT